MSLDQNTLLAAMRKELNDLKDRIRIMTYYDVKEAVKKGLSDEQIIENGPIRHEIKLYLPQARQEVEKERLIAESELGKVLYE